MSNELFYVWIRYPLGSIQMEAGPFDTLDAARTETADLMKDRHFGAVGMVGTDQSLPPGQQKVRYQIQGSVGR